MRPNAFSLTLALAATLALPAAIHAQTSGRVDAGASAGTPSTGAPSGFHFSLGLGAASMAAGCSQCNPNPFTDRLTGVSGFVQLGGAVNPQLVITGEFMGWISNDAPVYRRVAGLSLAFLGYPSLSSGFFIKGAFGGVRAIVEEDAFVVQTDAWMATTGIGYDIPVGSGLMITPYLNYVRSFGGTTSVNGLTAPAAVHPTALQFGAALTVH